VPVSLDDSTGQNAGLLLTKSTAFQRALFLNLGGGQGVTETSLKKVVASNALPASLLKLVHNSEAETPCNSSNSLLLMPHCPKGKEENIPAFRALISHHDVPHGNKLYQN